MLDSLETVVSELHHANGDRTRAYVAPFGVVTSVDPSAPTPADRCVKLTDHDRRQAREMRRIAEKYNTRKMCIRDRNILLQDDVFAFI